MKMVMMRGYCGNTKNTQIQSLNTHIWMQQRLFMCLRHTWNKTTFLKNKSKHLNDSAMVYRNIMRMNESINQVYLPQLQGSSSYVGSHKPRKYISNVKKHLHFL